VLNIINLNKYMQRTIYRYFSEYYDDFIGKGVKDIYNSLVIKYLRENRIKQGIILEIACGTGEIIETFSGKHKTYGLDISSCMIKKARNKNGKSKYFVANMTNFKLPEKFDAIICPFDSINHLQSFSDWKKVFANSSSHLKNGGVFIFDFNTIDKFRNINGKIILKDIRNNYVVMKTVRKKNECLWDILIFKKINGNKFQLFTERVIESTFPLGRIKIELNRYFAIKKIIDYKKERTFIICQKKPDNKMPGAMPKELERNH
jgi:SAM-dependent methyltransferase